MTTIRRCGWSCGDGARPLARSKVLGLRAALLAGLTLVLFTPLAAAEKAGDAPAVTFTEHVAPIFMSRCVECHRPGEVAPMSLLTFDEARPWAKSIRRAVLEREMPPWDANPAVGRFANDISLSAEEIATIVSWVDQGAARGEPHHMPPAPTFSSGWRLGEPDYVIELPEMEVPASGEDRFPNLLVELELDQESYLRAVELAVGNRAVLHHLVLFEGVLTMGEEVIDRRPAERRGARLRDAPKLLYVWAAGSPPVEYPDGVGHTLAARQVVSMNFHYHPSGEATTDASKIGLYFAKERPRKELATATAVNPSLYVPAHAADHSERAYYLFAQDSRLLSFLPHMHLRGRSISYHLEYPDGRRETLLDVPDYDFNWQWIYALAEPKPVPAGTVLEVVGHWDNSADNRNNPDPSVDIRFGDGSNYEMLVGFADFVVEEGVAAKPADPAWVVARLLARHPVAHTFTARSGFLQFGFYAPPVGDGMLYVTLGETVISAGVRDIAWDGGRVAMNSNMLTGAADSIPFGIVGEVSAVGEISGRLLFGQRVSTGQYDDLGAQGQPFTGQRLTAASAPAGR